MTDETRAWPDNSMQWGNELLLVPGPRGIEVRARDDADPTPAWKLLTVTTRAELQGFLDRAYPEDDRGLAIESWEEFEHKAAQEIRHREAQRDRAIQLLDDALDLVHGVSELKGAVLR